MTKDNTQLAVEEAVFYTEEAAKLMYKFIRELVSRLEEHDCPDGTKVMNDVINAKYDAKILLEKIETNTLINEKPTTGEQINGRISK